MKKKEILEKLNKLDLDKDKYTIISGASLVMHGIIKETDDIDLACSKEYYDKINWDTKMGYFNKEIKYIDDIEIGPNFYYEDSVDIIDGFRFMNLEKCLELKKLTNRDKDKKVIKKIEFYFRSLDNYSYEKELISKGYKLIGGVDEVGRGPLVGPVVAACVILPINYTLEGLTDSKKLSEKKRNEFYDIIKRDAISIGVGVASSKEIDEINILEASRLAMKRAIENMDIKPDFVLSDAMKLDNINIPYQDIIKGDILSLSIAAGSVIAKVTRDNMMYELDKKYPMYGFGRHKGYPTKEHLEMIKKYGVLDNYRFTYKPVSDLINK